ncbi:SDR family NAD(P)-dependent oxidoreductase [Frondihabitans cladoniiphilus]|uniref:Glucose 1-dehydrogenase n=1 Tax=Frondihabitans cladoniiphilus TaxID=715785 RepID=A0ABP8VW49_9MICO
MSYTDKIVLVTGGASGIGRATVEKFARAGATVVFTDIGPNLGEPLQAELAEVGLKTELVISNATVEADVVSLVQGIVSRHGRLDVAINNVGNMAGGDRPGLDLHETSTDAFEGTMAVSFTDNFYALKYEIIQMLAQGGGVIANTVSIAGTTVFELTSPTYSAAKAATIHLTEFAAVRYARDNIRINAVAPGIVETPSLAATPEETRNAALALLPSGRFQQAEDIANAFFWLCSDEAANVTGIVIPVDGGYSAK